MDIGEFRWTLPRTQNAVAQALCQTLSMDPFSIHVGKIAVLPGDNIDTDRIIPARFLSRVSRGGYGDLLFADVRGEGFALDQPVAQGASILVVGSNFGCGSSREHAVWAIQQAGYKAVVARKTDQLAGFSDIFRQNAANCGMLLIELAVADHDIVVNAGSGETASIHLPEQELRIGDHKLGFEMNEGTKRTLLEGLDLIGTTLVMEEEITSYESRADEFVPSVRG